MRFLMSALSGLRDRVPMTVGLLFFWLGFFIWKEYRLNIEVAMIGGMIIGYLVGIFIKRLIPDPEDKAL